MTNKKRQKKKSSPFTFIFLAVLAHLAGFPTWIVFMVGLVGVLMWQVQKSQQGSDKLPPLPPAEAEIEMDSESQRTEDVSAQAPYAPEKIMPAPQTYREPLPVETPPPWASSDYQAYPTKQTAVKEGPFGRASLPQKQTVRKPPSGAYQLRSQAHPLARSLRGRSGARQAIIAMTVLGQPRSLQPYEFEPAQQADVAPPRSA